MNREVFFDAIEPALGLLSAKQMNGMGHLLDAGKGLPLHHMAHVLAHVRRETGGYMFPIKETVMPHHKDKNPSDATVIARLDKAFKSGKLSWVKTPYWRDGWFGRGHIQITHKANYAKFGITDPAEALDPAVSARVAVLGMSRGMFTGRKLSDYTFPAALDAAPSKHPRRIVNGVDGSDKEVSRYHREFAAALEAAGWVVNGGTSTAPPKPAEAPQRPIPQKPVTPQPAPKLGLAGAAAALLAALALALSGVWENITQFFGG